MAPHEHPDPPKPPGKRSEYLQYVKDLIAGPYTDEQKENALEALYAAE